MISLMTPLQIAGGQMGRTPDLRTSIDRSLELLLNTPVGSTPVDPGYGFVFTALRFENFDESQGTVYDAGKDKKRLYQLKISGSSKNLQTFAAELNDTIRTYEPRLRDTSAVMTYVRQDRTIIVAIRGVIAQTREPYEYHTIIKVWS